MKKRKEEFYYKNLSGCVEISYDAAKMLRDIVTDFDKDKLKSQLAEMRELEQKGDSKKHKMMEALSQAFITPIEREDLIALSNYLDDITDAVEDVMSAADLIISRAGASTISEITALAKPAILVPSPNVTNNHQEKNARVLAEKGGAVLLLEQECSAEMLYQTTRELLADPRRLSDMSKALREMQVADASEQIYQTLVGLIK